MPPRLEIALGEASRKGPRRGLHLACAKLNTYQSSWGRRSRRTLFLLLLLLLFINPLTTRYSYNATHHCLSSHSRVRNVPPHTHTTIRVLTDQHVLGLYQCPCSRLMLARVKHAILSCLFLPFLDHAVLPGGHPSLQYQEPRNSDLFSQFPLLLALA